MQLPDWNVGDSVVVSLSSWGFLNVYLLTKSDIAFVLTCIATVSTIALNFYKIHQSEKRKSDNPKNNENVKH